MTWRVLSFVKTGEVGDYCRTAEVGVDVQDLGVNVVSSDVLEVPDDAAGLERRQYWQSMLGRGRVRRGLVADSAADVDLIRQARRSKVVTGAENVAYKCLGPGMTVDGHA